MFRVLNLLHRTAGDGLLITCNEVSGGKCRRRGYVSLFILKLQGQHNTLLTLKLEL